jgi:hypothetical protein
MLEALISTRHVILATGIVYFFRNEKILQDYIGVCTVSRLSLNIEIFWQCRERGWNNRNAMVLVILAGANSVSSAAGSYHHNHENYFMGFNFKSLLELEEAMLSKQANCMPTLDRGVLLWLLE